MDVNIVAACIVGVSNLGAAVVTIWQANKTRSHVQTEVAVVGNQVSAVDTKVTTVKHELAAVDNKVAAVKTDVEKVHEVVNVDLPRQLDNATAAGNLVGRAFEAAAEKDRKDRK